MSEQLIIEKQTLEGIADAVREKKGTTEKIPVVNLEDEIRNISGLTIDGVPVTEGMDLISEPMFIRLNSSAPAMYYKDIFVEVGDKLYIISANSSYNYIYGYDGTSWVKMAGYANFYSSSVSQPHDGKLYFVYSTSVYSTDGTTTTYIKSTP